MTKVIQFNIDTLSCCSNLSHTPTVVLTIDNTLKLKDIKTKILNEYFKTKTVYIKSDVYNNLILGHNIGSKSS